MDREATLEALALTYGTPSFMRQSVQDAVNAGYSIVSYYERQGKVWEVLGFVRGFNRQPLPISYAAKIKAWFDWERRERHQQIREGYRKGLAVRVHYHPF